MLAGSLGYRRSRSEAARLLATAPALAMLMLAPIAHAAPHPLPFCGNVVLPLPALALPPAKKRAQRQAKLCAPAPCPRELRVDRKRSA